MGGRIESHLTLMKGDAGLYDGLAREFASPEFAALLAGTLPKGHVFKYIHPLANMLPMLPEAQRETFRASLSDGQNHPVIIHNNMLLDGRNRARELIYLKKPISAARFTGTPFHALEYVKAENIERRHLNETQRAVFAARVADMKLGANQHSKPAPIGAPSLPLGGDASEEPAAAMLSQGEAAEMFNISRRSVQRATTVLEKGAPELQAAVEQGNVAVSIAAEIAERPLTEQKAILESLPRDATGKLTAEAKKEVRKVAKEVRAEDQAEKKKKRDDKEKKFGDTIKARGKFGVVLEDFEWDHEPYSRETGMDRHPSNHYPTAAKAHTPEEIVAVTAERFECADEKCVLYMWTTIPHCSIAMEVIRLRGFEYKSQRCWDKVRTGDGRGTGYWVTGEHELLLIATRGGVVAPVSAHFPSRFEAPVGKHSEKPDQQYEHAEFHFPNTPKIELNARRARPGWDRWGNEAPEPEQPALGLEPAEAAE